MGRASQTVTWKSSSLPILTRASVNATAPKMSSRGGSVGSDTGGLSSRGSTRRASMVISPPQTRLGARSSSSVSEYVSRSGPLDVLSRTRRQRSYTAASTQPPDTLPTARPRLSTARAGPRSRGVLPCTSTMLASAYGRPVVCQAPMRSVRSDIVITEPGIELGIELGFELNTERDLLGAQRDPAQRTAAGVADGGDDRRCRGQRRGLAGAAQAVRRIRVGELED